MFEKALIVDDYALVNRGVTNLVSSLGVEKVDTALYCDDAYLKIRKASDIDREPYDLIITDLSFKEDYRECILENGQDLVKKLHLLYPELKIIVYSQEENFQKIRELLYENGATGYVCKSRTSEKELVAAIHSAFNDKKYISSDVPITFNKHLNNELSVYEKEVAKQLAMGLSQPEMSNYFKKFNISPSSLSSIEKCINRLKEQYNANNATHLIALLKDRTLI